VTEWHELWFVGDQHLGAEGCAEDKIKEYVRRIADSPRARVALMGDCGDFINLSDKRFDIQQVAKKYHMYLDDLPKVVADDFVKIYLPIKDKLICLIPGNHEETVRKRYSSHVARDIARMLGIPLLDTISQLRVRVQSQNEHRKRSFLVKGVLSHAHKSSTTLGGKMSATEKIFDFFGDHDFIAQAHMHEYGTHSGRNMDVAGVFGRPRVYERNRMLFLTGGYLKTYGPGSGYGETRAYRPCRLGSPHLKMRLWRGTHDRVELEGI
jgi:hypothetical protein